MRIESKKVFKNSKCYLNFHKKMGRWQVCIVSDEGRTTITYAKFLMSEKLGYLIPRDLQVHHIDGDKTNDCISNLELLTYEEHKKRTRERFEEKWPRLVCLNCGNLYKRVKRNVKKETKFCSRKCLHNSMRK